jgi:elongation factor G
MNELVKMQLEDPSITIKRNVETKQLLLGGLSSTHIDYLLERIRTNNKIVVTTEEEKTVYRESITCAADGDGRYIKQSGGSGFYGVVAMHFEPCEESTFEETVFGGAVPKNYFPAVEKGFYEALTQGQLAGFPVIGVKGILTDGKYHSVDSNELSFKMAAILAFKDAYHKCKPVILEPIVRAKISVNSEFIGTILSDLNSRRGKVQNIIEGEHDRQEIIVLIPESEIKDYATKLKALTQGTGFFTRTFEKYEKLPDYLKDKVIKENSLLDK